MQIVQLLESETSKVYSRLLNLDLPEQLISIYFKKLRPKKWQLTGNRFSWFNLINSLNLYDPVSHIHPAFLFYNNDSGKSVILRVYGLKTGQQSAHLETAMVSAESYSFEENIIKKRTFDKIELQKVFEAIKLLLSVSANDNIISVWSSIPSEFKASPAGVERYELRKDYNKFMKKMHNIIWIKIRRRLRSENNSFYRDFIQEVDSKSQEVLHKRKTYLVQLWLSIITEFGDKVAEKKIPFETAEDRNKLLNYFVNRYLLPLQ